MAMDTESEKRIMNLKSKLWYFWGSMDVLALLLYSVNSLRQDRIPFISDLIAFTGNSDVFQEAVTTLS
jgi:hypothetical protein